MPAGQPHFLLDLVGSVPLHARQAAWLLWGVLAGLIVYTQRRRAPGWPRLLVAAPIILINLAIPLIFNGDEEVLANFAAAIASAWISNFKLFGWILGRGSLTGPLTAAQFAAVYCLPLIPSEGGSPEEVADESEGPAAGAARKQSAASAAAMSAAGKNGDEAEERKKGGRVHESYSTSFMFVRFLAKAVALTWTAIQLETAKLTGLPLLLLRGFSQVLILSIAADGLGALVSATLGLKIAPHFEFPYFATSVADFWNNRWNLVVSNILRSCLYDPIMEGRLVKRPGEFPRLPFSRGRRMAAVLLVFVVSGMVHEALFWYQSGRFTPHLLWLWHFVLWGAIIVAENVGKRVLRKMGVRVPTLLANLLFLVLLHFMLGVFWFPPLLKMGVMQKGAASVVMGWEWLKRHAAAQGLPPLSLG